VTAARRPRHYQHQPTPRELALEAADKLEDFLAHMTTIVGEIYENRIDAYATLYRARRQLTDIMRPLGAGEPSRQLRVHDWGDDV
jgi:hypothetical protein